MHFKADELPAASTSVLKIRLLVSPSEAAFFLSVSQSGQGGEGVLTSPAHDDCPNGVAVCLSLASAHSVAFREHVVRVTGVREVTYARSPVDAHLRRHALPTE